MKIRAQKYTSKTSSNKSSNLTISLRGSEKLLPLDESFKTVNEIELYNNERANCSKLRLTCIINPICSNILANNITEIVKNEGSNECKLLNYNGLGGPSIIKQENLITAQDLSHIKYKTYNFFLTGSGAINAVRDTQLSNTDNGFGYHCGLNIFNNHILRSKTFKTVCKLKSSYSDNFNTLSDMMRNMDGSQIRGYTDYMTGTNKPNINMHLYLGQDVLSFKQCVSDKMSEENGWIGFYNSGKFPTYDIDNHDKPLDIYQTINNKKACGFVDLSPERDLFYVTPKYNKFRRRIEKNWNYCLTYPSSSTTNISFIRPKTNSLMVCAFDDTITTNGVDSVIIHSVSKHGLNANSTINLYISDSIVIRNAVVSQVVDDYTFYIHSGGVKLPAKWRSISTLELQSKKFEADIDGVNTTIYIGQNNSYCFYFKGKDMIKLPLIKSPNYKVNLDKSSLDMSYKLLIEGEEVEYYVRIFSKIPNWKYCDESVDKYSIYKNDSRLIRKYQTSEYEFENHIGALAFAKNIYGDDISEIVFTDDIDFSMLKDNLGRPLTTIYLTLIKNNKGYKEWYGKDGTVIDLGNENVEFSHVFGKLNCAFRLSPKSLYDSTHINSSKINNIDSKMLYEFSGLNVNEMQPSKRPTTVKLSDDEIEYNVVYDSHNNQVYGGDVNFYGDLCCYSHALLDEKVIQPIEYRFNTAQRELLKASDNSASAFFNQFEYDEIERDDYDFTKEYVNASESDQTFLVKTYDIEGACQRREGYVYNPHFPIQIQSFHNSISSVKPIYLNITSVEQQGESLAEFNVVLSNKHHLSIQDNFTLKYYNTDTKTNIYTQCTVDKVITDHKISFTIMSVINKDMTVEDFLLLLQGQYPNNALGDIIKRYCKITLPDETVPDYAELSTDGSAIYMWRDIVKNGFDGDSDIESYPFTNGALYINRRIDLFVRRQDPNETAQLASKTYPFDYMPKVDKSTDENNFYLEQEMEC